MVYDFGRQFLGQAEISAWNAREDIGAHNRIEVTGVRPDGDGIIGSVQVRGDGYNGGGTSAIRSRGDEIQSMVIRGCPVVELSAPASRVRSTNLFARRYCRGISV